MTQSVQVPLGDWAEALPMPVACVKIRSVTRVAGNAEPRIIFHRGSVAMLESRVLHHPVPLNHDLKRPRSSALKTSMISQQAGQHGLDTATV
jgi:hypothetical protein